MDLRIEKHYAQLLPAPSRMGWVDAADGTRLAWRSFGERSDKLPFLCCNGIGCSVLFWRLLVDAFQGEREIILWDYRGHGLSQNPEPGAVVGIEDNSDDAVTVLKEVGYDKAIFLGHSMGAQVILETFRRHPETVGALIPVLGAFSRPLSTFLDSEVPQHIFPFISEFAQLAPGLITNGSKLVAALPIAHRAAGLMGLINHKLVSDVDFRAYMDHVVRLDPAFFMRMGERAGVHDAGDVLVEIDVPTLIVAGQWDLFTPGWVSEAMHKRISGSELLMIPGGTHTALIEQPELMHLRIEKLLATKVDVPRKTNNGKKAKS